MKYEIRQRIFSFGDSFTIRDEYGNDRYLVRGEVFSFGNKLRILDLAGNEIIYIEQKLFHFLPEYNIFIRGNYAATVKKELSFFRPKFFIESSMGSYSIDGDVFSHEFSILKNGKEVAFVSKAWFSFSDTYGADITESEDQAFMLAMVIVVDQVLYDKKD